MTPAVRPATEDDLPGILAIHNDAIRNTTAIWIDAPVELEDRRIWLREHRRRGFPVLVAADAGDVLGIASYGDFNPRDGYRYTVENSIYVRADLRGRGLGTLMMPPLIAEARKAGKHTMIAAIEAGNDASIRLHARFGFRKAAHLPEVGRKFDRWLDLVLMQLMLDS